MDTKLTATNPMNCDAIGYGEFTLCLPAIKRFVSERIILGTAPSPALRARDQNLP